ncbi:MAG: hypothetical protein LBK06_00045 [Planctomycetaceae bacterium]|nr:hypothetical protein [Planctomycetaceae bacterium]
MKRLLGGEAYCLTGCGITLFVPESHIRRALTWITPCKCYATRGHNFIRPPTILQKNIY